MKSKLCLLFKLKSGEEIISHIVKKTKLKYIVENPFVFKNTTVVHPVTTQTHEIITIHDWLKLTETKTTDIPMNHIVSVLNPSTETIDVYNKELKNRSKVNLSSKSNKTKISKDSEPKSNKPTDKEIEKLLKDMFGSIFEIPETSDQSYSADPSITGTTPEEFNKNPIDLYNELWPPKDKTK